VELKKIDKSTYKICEPTMDIELYLNGPKTEIQLTRGVREVEGFADRRYYINFFYIKKEELQPLIDGLCRFRDEMKR